MCVVLIVYVCSVDCVCVYCLLCLGKIVAVDSVSPTVFVISESGELLKWFDCSEYMREPSDIVVNGKEYFVCDFKVCLICSMPCLPEILNTAGWPKDRFSLCFL